eukprot:scaffold62969_cov51-Phaeocystis_antarctica.AAC.1
MIYGVVQRPYIAGCAARSRAVSHSSTLSAAPRGRRPNWSSAPSSARIATSQCSSGAAGASGGDGSRQRRLEKRARTRLRLAHHAPPRALATAGGRTVSPISVIACMAVAAAAAAVAAMAAAAAAASAGSGASVRGAWWAACGRIRLERELPAARRAHADPHGLALAQLHAARQQLRRLTPVRLRRARGVREWRGLPAAVVEVGLPAPQHGVEPSRGACRQLGHVAFRRLLAQSRLEEAPLLR